jgi:hypothetical protein
VSQIFRRNKSQPSSGSKGDPCKKPTEAGGELNPAFQIGMIAARIFSKRGEKQEYFANKLELKFEPPSIVRTDRRTLFGIEKYIFKYFSLSLLIQGVQPKRKRDMQRRADGTFLRDYCTLPRYICYIFLFCFILREKLPVFCPPSPSVPCAYWGSNWIIKRSRDKLRGPSSIVLNGYQMVFTRE